MKRLLVVGIALLSIGCGRAALVVVDDNGDVVGRIFNAANSSPLILIPIPNDYRWGQVQTNRQGLAPQAVTVYYSSNDCTGAGYIQVPTESNLITTMYGGYQNTYTYSDNTNLTITSNSNRTLFSSGYGDCEFGNRPGMGASGLLEMDMGDFTPPFSIE